MARKQAVPGHCTIRPHSQRWNSHSPFMTGKAEAAVPEEEAVCSCGLSRPHNPLTSRATVPACHAGVAGNVHDRGRGWGESVGNGGPFKWWEKVLPGSGESRCPGRRQQTTEKLISLQAARPDGPASPTW